jgi:dTMP kinase
MTAGLFLSLDGIDGTGKSTQCELLAQWLRQCGLTVLTCSDPGSTPLGLLLRDILLHQKHDIALTSETLLFMASRAQLVARLIAPALERNEVVVCDRFLLANVVYQGHAGGLEPKELWQLGAFATSGREPDLTLVLDLPLDLAQQRRNRPADRLESRGPDYLERVRIGFLTEAQRQPERIQVVDASGSTAMVQERIQGLVEPLLARYSLR